MATIPPGVVTESGPCRGRAGTSAPSGTSSCDHWQPSSLSARLSSDAPWTTGSHQVLSRPGERLVRRQITKRPPPGLGQDAKGANPTRSEPLVSIVDAYMKCAVIPREALAPVVPPGMLVTVIERTFLGGMSLEIPFYGARRLNGSIGTAQLRVSQEGLWTGRPIISGRSEPAESSLLLRQPGTQSVRRDDPGEYCLGNSHGHEGALALEPPHYNHDASRQSEIVGARHRRETPLQDRSQLANAPPAPFPSQLGARTRKYSIIRDGAGGQT
jgi:hypothetical protein